MQRHRRGSWIAAVMQAAWLGGTGHATPAVPAETAAIDGALLALGGADLAVIDTPVPGRAPSALVATRVAVAPAALAAVLADPRAYREAIPALVRAEVVDRRRAPGATVDEQLLQWELEIPLFNLKGKAWITPRAGGVDLTLVEGDLAPGKLAFTWAPANAGTILVLQSQANVRAAGWFFRRIASRSPFGEAAMNVTAAYVVLRAAAERALHPSDESARRPRAAPAPPAPAALITDAPALSEGPALRPFLRRATVAAVRRADSGRLASVALVTPIAGDAPTLRDRLASPENWSAFPGWKKVKPLAGDRVSVEDSLPFVDFETTWQLRRDRAGGFTAIAADGAIRGALFAWDVRPAPGDWRPSLAVLSLYPRLEASGYIPRKFIAAEPLLEHGMALALAYVDAMSMAARVGPTTAGK
jgi:hypothetical protein